MMRGLGFFGRVPAVVNTFVGKTAAQWCDETPAWPVGTAAGDLAIYTSGAVPTFLYTTNGYNRIIGPNHTPTGATLYVYWKILTSGDVAGTATLEPSVTESRGAFYVYRCPSATTLTSKTTLSYGTADPYTVTGYTAAGSHKGAIFVVLSSSSTTHVCTDFIERTSTGVTGAELDVIDRLSGYVSGNLSVNPSAAGQAGLFFEVT